MDADFAGPPLRLFDHLCGQGTALSAQSKLAYDFKSICSRFHLRRDKPDFSKAIGPQDLVLNVALNLGALGR